MRPLVLELDNFTSFRTRQRLDLQDCDLFAIAGPTGSGKSSLLDALVFALYGRVPRMGRSCGEMISLGRDRMSVSLDFRSGAATYRVTRVLRRTGRGAEAQLERLTDDGPEPLADGVRRVDEEVQRILGLGYDAFTQAVILPQGEFATFLKSGPADRQKILRDLLRLQVYEKMRKAAGEETARLSQQVLGWEAVLQTEYAGATPEAIASLDHERAALALQNRRLTEAMASAESVLLDLRRRRSRTIELDDARTRLVALQEEAAAIRDLEQRLQDGRRATGVVPRLDAAQAAALVASRAGVQAAEIASAEVTAVRAHDDTVRALAAASLAAEETVVLDRRIADLGEAVALSGLLHDARRRADEARATHHAGLRELQAAARGAAVAQADGIRLRDAAVAAEARVLALAYDAARHEHLDGLRERATAIASLRAAARRAVGERLAAAAEHDRAHALTLATTEAARLSFIAWEAREAAWRRAEQALRQAERDHAVARLRHEMQPGDACPVCEQTVGRVPAQPAEASLVALEAACREAGADERAARKAQAEAQGRDAAAGHALAHAASALARAREDEAEAEAALSEAVRALWRDAGPHLPPREQARNGSRGRAARAADRPSASGPSPSGPRATTPELVTAGAGGERDAGPGALRSRRARAPRRESTLLPLFDEPLVAAALPATSPQEDGHPETLLLGALSELSVLRQEHDSASAAHEQALRALERAEREHERLGDRVVLLERALSEAVRAKAEAESGVAELESRIAALGGGDDPPAQRDALARHRTMLVTAHDAAREAERAAATTRATVEAQAHEAGLRAAECATALAVAQAAADAALHEAGFAEAAEARAAFVPVPQQDRMAAQVAGHAQARTACEGRIRELSSEIGESRVDAPSLAAKEAAWADQRRHHDEGVRREATLDQRLCELRQRAEQAEARARELEHTRRRHALQRQLADDLRSDAFQAYLLEEAFRELVKGASVRLFELSNRYTLEFHGDAFHVLDHDNARERRSAETLSGGETFLASLALALELSQEVQRSAGAVPLESLFIDEGFGTLDPETLETIADAILALPQAGRMVGIITHIAELTERLPVCVQVAKRPDGSTVELRR